MEDAAHRREDSQQRGDDTYRTVADFLPEIIWETDATGRFLWTNQRGFDLTGYTVHDIERGVNIAQIVAPEHLARLKANIAALFGGAGGFAHEYDIRRKDGTTFPALVHTIPVMRDGKIVGLRGILADVSERRRSEEQTARSQRLLQSVVDAIQDGISVLDRDLNIVQVNKTQERWFSQSAPVIGKRCYAAYHGRTEPCERCAARRALETQRLQMDMVERSEQGRGPGWLEMYAVPLFDAAGNLVGVVEYGRDVTDRRRAEQSLLRVQKLDSLGTLAGGIAHDFNNLLTGMFGSIEVARRQVPDDSPIGPLLDDAMSAWERARDLTRRLLTFAKGGAPMKAVVPVSPLVTQTVRFALSGSNVDVAFAFEPALPACEIDPNQIEQVIENIVINAKQAMPAGGAIEVAARAVRVDEGAVLPLAPGPYVRISITDHGTGISREVLPRIFDPFFTTKPKGQGLGLATSHSIVKRHDGHIEVESSPAVGSTFSVYLPAVHAGHPPPVSQARDAAISAAHVLVVDDDEAVRHVLAQMLRQLGCMVASVADGDAALALIARAPARFDTVIVDLTIRGGRGGKEIVRELRRLGPSMRLIVSSGYSEDPIMSDPQSFGFDDVLPKPFHLGDLSELLRAVPARTRPNG